MALSFYPIFLFFKHITWLKSNQTIDFEYNKNYYIENVEIENTGTKTILFFKEVTQDDFLANFTCRASNSHGHSSRVIRIIPMSNKIDFMTQLLCILYLLNVFQLFYPKKIV